VRVYSVINGTVTVVGEAVAASDGSFKLETGALVDGAQELLISATDVAGNESARVSVGTWTIDTNPPATPVITSYSQDPKDTDGSTERDDLRLVGTSEPGSSVEIFDGDRLLGVVITDTNGNWVLPSTGKLGVGEHRFATRSKDAAGNTSLEFANLKVNVLEPLAIDNNSADGVTFRANAGQPMNMAIPASGGTGPYSFTIASGILPNGLELDPETGFITGTVKGQARSNVTVRVVDSRDNSFETTLNFRVDAAEKPFLVSSGSGKVTNVGKIPDAFVNSETYLEGTAVTLYDAKTMSPAGQAVPFPGYKGDVRVALEDIDNDGRVDIIAASGVGARAHIKVLDLESGQERKSFWAFDPGYLGGTYVASGDVNKDNIPEIAVVSGAGTRGHVKVFDGATGAEIASFYAWEAGFTGGGTIAIGDTDGDGLMELVVGKGPGEKPLVRIFQLNQSVWELRNEFLAFAEGFRGGTFVAVGDIGRDGRIEIAVGAGAGASATVSVFNAANQALLDSFYAYGEVDTPGKPFKGGVRVAIQDFFMDGTPDLITGAGPGAYPHLRVWDIETLSQIASLLVADSEYRGGVNLG